jgi:predicted DNA binding protein
MAQATFSVTLPETVWIQQVSSTYPAMTFEVLAAVPSSESGFALVRLTGADVSAALEDVQRHPQLVEVSVVQRSVDEATVHFESTMPLVLFSSRDAGVPIELPVTIREGIATIEVTGSRERLSAFAEQLSRFDLQYRIEALRERLHDDQLLSQRQRELVVAAVEAGYYDTPRRTSLTELAATLDIAKSTCSETLHRAEGAIITQFVEGLSATEAAAPSNR